ncbi:MAG TPA: FtsX-like permease family protein, partial [Burkholderiales bacterium]|nr:FtsX-like permease family protein [Burkholderiales bacterium]
LQQVPLGFSAENVLTARLTLPAARYQDPDVVAGAYRRMLEQVRAIPGVERAGASTNIPQWGSSTDAGLTVEGRTFGPGAMPSPHFRLVSEEYFEAVRMPLRRGRLFQASDMTAGAPRAVVINERLASSIWPGEDPLGKRISAWTPTPEPEWREVVGVIGDVRTFGQDDPVEPEMFVPYTQAPGGAWDHFQRSMALVARTAADPADSTSLLRRAVWSVDPSLPLYDVRTMDQVLAISGAARRFGTLLLLLLAATGLALAAVGIYGVIAYFVTQRTPEIGLRLALGATTGSVLGLVLRHGAILALAGISTGIVAALAATRVLTSLLFEISPTDPATYVVGALGLFVIALLACVVPALRAARIDPVRSLAGS